MLYMQSTIVMLHVHSSGLTCMFTSLYLTSVTRFPFAFEPRPSHSFQELRSVSTPRQSVCTQLIVIALDCSDPHNHKYCHCYPWSSPTQVDWVPERTVSPTLASPFEPNQTQHNTTQPIRETYETEDHCANHSFQYPVLCHEQEPQTIDPSLLQTSSPYGSNSTPTSVQEIRTPSYPPATPIAQARYKSQSYPVIPQVTADRHVCSGANIPHHCPITNCNQTFTRPQDLRRHQRVLHGVGSQCLPCPAANCAYTTEKCRKDNLKRHVKRWHPGLLWRVVGL